MIRDDKEIIEILEKRIKKSEAILDKIRAEIEQEIIPRNSDQYDHEAMWQNMGLRIALKVINKYKAESEGKYTDKCTYKKTGCGSCKRQLDCPMNVDKTETEAEDGNDD